MLGTWAITALESRSAPPSSADRRPLFRPLHLMPEAWLNHV